MVSFPPISSETISGMAANSPSLLAAIDMGTNSFKMVLVRAEPNGKFYPIDRLKEPIRLGSATLADGSIGSEAEQRSVLALQSFMSFLEPLRAETKVVATSAIREAKNRDEILKRINEKTRANVVVLSGEEEASLIYLGVLQFLPVYDKTVLTVDIGGGSTEFVLGRQGKVLYATSLNLGHVVLTERFVRNGEIEDMRIHIENVIRESGLVEKVKEIEFEIAVGSSGTIKSIEKAVYFRSMLTMNAVGGPRGWRFSREELGAIVENLWSSDVGAEQARLLGFPAKRAEFVLAGSVLLLEIFNILGIAEMEVSGYGLGEGVIAEMLARSCEHYDVNANIRWQSVSLLATRFNGKKRMRSAVQCTGIAKGIFEGLKTIDECGNVLQAKSGVYWEAKDVEYLEAAILLHGIGLFVGKKGYQKHSYHIIKNGGHLHGYGPNEIELIALLARYHRKKFPKHKHSCLQDLSDKMQQKFRALCVVVRISLSLQQCQSITFQGLEILHCPKGYKLFLKQVNDHMQVPDCKLPASSAINKELKPELEHFKEVKYSKDALYIIIIIIIIIIAFVTSVKGYAHSVIGVAKLEVNLLSTHFDLKMSNFFVSSTSLVLTWLVQV